MDQQPAASPSLFFETINAYQKTEALRAAIELDVFTQLADAPAAAPEIASRCRADARGVRILCDYLALLGFLTKSVDQYALTPDSAAFLNRRSPAYAGGTLEFLLSDDLRCAFGNLTAAVRAGGTAQTAGGTVAHEHPVWISFARSMSAIMGPAAAGLAELLPLPDTRATKVLDVSASHGAWGLAFARKNPRTHLVALDWASVLEISRENARKSGVEDRFSTIAGSAFDVELGAEYDVVLAPNFLHHFSTADCIKFLKKAHRALRPGGKIAIVEFVPNEDRVTPPPAAGFALVMLATTPAGDAYTFAEYADMLAQAGFKPPTQAPLPSSMNIVILAEK